MTRACRVGMTPSCEPSSSTTRTWGMRIISLMRRSRLMVNSLARANTDVDARPDTRPRLGRRGRIAQGFDAGQRARRLPGPRFPYPLRPWSGWSDRWANCAVTALFGPLRGPVVQDSAPYRATGAVAGLICTGGAQLALSVDQRAASPAAGPTPNGARGPLRQAALRAPTRAGLPAARPCLRPCGERLRCGPQPRGRPG